jgi:hypothetical protein
VDTHACPGAATLSSARLVIHTGSDAGASVRHVKSLLRWLRSLYSPRPSPGEPLELRIEDLQGRQVLAFGEGGPLIVVALPAGTYHVNAQLGSLQRRYTMALQAGTSFDLYLNLAPHRK